MAPTVSCNDQEIVELSPPVPLWQPLYLKKVCLQWEALRMRRLTGRNWNSIVMDLFGMK